MSKELIEITEKPQIPENWNYDNSVQKVKTLIYKWKNLTEELFKEFYIAREKLSSRYHRDGRNIPSWAKYCEEIGSSKRTINQWLQKWQQKKLIKLTVPKIEAKVIYADPPWPYKNTGFDESAKQHYNIMTMKEILNLSKVKEVKAPAVLFLWVTYPFAEEGFQVCKEWGFNYKAQLVWKKNKGPSIGWFTKPRHELLYIATKGVGVHPQVRYESVFEAEVTEHSKKPEIVYEMIEKMYSGPYIELFAREKRENWDSWGNEL